MRIALVQMYVEPGDVLRNLSRASELAANAASQGAQIVLLPEALPFGWMDGSAKNGASAIPDGIHSRHFAEIAQRNHVYLCAGIVERQGSSNFNSAVLISPEGQILLHHRKINELRIAHDCYALGDRLNVIDTPLGRIGLMICADGFAPGQSITRSLGLMGAQLILSPCAWAVPPEHDNHVTPYGKLWLDNYGPVASEFGLWIAGCSNVGPIRSGPWAGHRCIGCSLLIGPTGKPEVKGDYDKEQVILVEIKLNPRPRLSAE